MTIEKAHCGSLINLTAESKQAHLCVLFVAELSQVNSAVEPHSHTLNEGMIMQ